MNMFDLTGKTALVTGGNKGLGKGIAEGLCEAGAKVVILASSEQVFEAAEELRSKGYAAEGVRCDLSNEQDVAQTFDKALSILGGKLDIMVNNAGIQRRHPSEEFPMEDWDAVIQVNLRSVFQLCQLAGRNMLENGGGKIINLASMLSYFGGFTVPAYQGRCGTVDQGPVQRMGLQGHLRQRHRAGIHGYPNEHPSD